MSEEKRVINLDPKSLKIPDGNSIIIDFNKTYNPYCAYSHRYSCPVPPEENDLLVRIEAGVREYNKY